jgi:hypothetical protein
MLKKRIFLDAKTWLFCCIVYGCETQGISHSSMPFNSISERIWALGVDKRGRYLPPQILTQKKWLASWQILMSFLVQRWCKLREMAKVNP